MTRIIFIIFISLFWCVNLFAQTRDSLSKPRVQFCSKNELGGLIGIGRLKDASDYPIHNPEWALELTSINGIRYEPWFVGIGVGVRSWRGVGFGFPVYGHVALDLWKTSIFLHADLGYQIEVRKNYFGNRETGGFYAAYGLGYNFAIRKQDFYVKASICHQRAKAEDKHGGLGPSTYPENYSLTYLFFRVSLGLRITK